MIDALADLLADGGFQAGLLFGLLASIALAAVGVAGLVGRADGLAGVALAAATVLGLAVRSELPAGLLIGLLVVGATGAVSRRRRATTRALVAVPGALILAGTVDLDGGPSWIRPALVLVVAAAGPLVVSIDGGGGHRDLRAVERGGARSASPTRAVGLGPVLVAVTAFGVYATTPETEHVLVLAGAAVPVAVAAWLLRRPAAALGPTGSLLVTALVAWSVAIDGAARSGAIVGGLACLGLLALVPAMDRVCRHHPDRSTPDQSAVVSPRATTGWWSPVLLTVLHIGLVLVCSRGAGLRESAASALVISAGAYAVAAAVLLCWRRPATGRPA